jgi:hypothetical protein
VGLLHSLFPGGRPSLDINDRNAAILDWPDEYRTLMESWDKVFYACQQDLWQKLMRHILASGLDR